MKTVAMLLAGGEGSRLTVLSEKRAKPAVPFAGKFRIIDFTISNCVNSGVYTVGVLTQYRPHSLADHIGIGKPWNLDRSRGGIRVLPPFQERGGQHWYAGTADAIYQNLSFIRNQNADLVLILSGDHIYKMDYQAMIQAHLDKGADLTVAVMPVPIEETHRFGIMVLDGEQRVTEFYEKPKERDKGNLASMGIYIFNADILEKRISEAPGEKVDFGKHIIPDMVARGDRVYGYRFEGYWVDVGTVDSYWATNLALLGDNPGLDLYSNDFPIMTLSEERPAVKVGPQAKVTNSMISNGCVICGTVINSVLSPGVYVSPGAVVKDSVIMNDAWVGPGASLDKLVVDKRVRIGSGAIVGTGDCSVANEAAPDKLFAGITVIGKGSIVPAGANIGRNVLIGIDKNESDYPADGVVADGKSI